MVRRREHKAEAVQLRLSAFGLVEAYFYPSVA